MPETDTRYLRDLKLALTGDPAATLVWICNFEAEGEWARGYRGLPGLPAGQASPLVQRMEELGALLAGDGDVLVLKQPLDGGFAAYAAGLGLPRPTAVVPERTEPDRTTAADVLDSPRLLDRLTGLGQAGAWLMPMGTSFLEQKVAEVCGLRLAVPDAATFERVNGKIYGRRLTAAAGLRTVPGVCCETVAELTEALHGYRAFVEGGSAVVVKEAYGVSGKGLVVLDSSAKMDRLVSMATRRAGRSGDPRMHVVVEEWLPKRADLNYQFTIDSRGRVTLGFVKQLLATGGVYQGHLMPATLPPAALSPGHFTEIEQAAAAVGGLLHRDGFTGVAAADAVLATDGTLYPVLEINARLNMSSYQGTVTELIQPSGHAGLARHYALRLRRPLAFAGVRAALRRFEPPGEADGLLVITCFGTVNANAGQPAPFEGRLYVLLAAAGTERLTALDRQAQAALAALPDVLEVRS